MATDGDPILGEFFVKSVGIEPTVCIFTDCCRRFHEHASALNVSADDLYTALLADAEEQPPNWNLQGRQATVWKQYSQQINSHHVPFHDHPSRLHPF